MKRYLITLLGIVFSIMFLIILIFYKPTVETITYFPRDENVSFEETYTTMERCEESQHTCVHIYSQTNTNVHLRQDITLVFNNFHIQSLLNKWKENTAILSTNKTLQIPQNRYIHVITYHHGEIESNEQYTSVGQMSHFEGFIQDLAPKQASSLPYEKIKAEYQHKMSDALDNLQIQKDHYHIFPLSELPSYEEKPFPSMTQQRTDKTIGQLWEGLYKNYVILMMEESKMHTNLMPLVLLAKDQSHLLVIYNMNEKYQILRQNL